MLLVRQRHGTGDRMSPGPPLDWWEVPPEGIEALRERLIKVMCPERVCQRCGEPSRRQTTVHPQTSSLTSIAKAIQEARELVGYTRTDLVGLFPHYKNANSVTAQFSNWERAKSVPTSRDWRILRKVLPLDDQFDSLIDGARVWSESTVEYVTDTGRLVEGESWPSGMLDGNRGAHSHKTLTATRIITTTGWSDCGHDDWRPGVIIGITP